MTLVHIILCLHPGISETAGFYGLPLPSVGEDTHRDNSVKNNLLIDQNLSTVCSGVGRFHKQKYEVLSDHFKTCLTP